jgi:hypothetical protein
MVGKQRWSELLFAHWKIDAPTVQATLPRGLFVDTFAGDAYIGVVPFFMQRVRPAWLPPLPWISWFLELNVRTYVHDENGNSKMDMAIFVPKEGFGFSRNPAIVTGPPKFKAAAFAIDAPEVSQRVKMKYML